MTWQITEPIRCTLPRPLPCPCGYASIQDLEYERLPTQFLFFFSSFHFSFSFLTFSSVWMVYVWTIKRAEMTLPHFPPGLTFLGKAVPLPHRLCLLAL